MCGIVGIVGKRKNIFYSLHLDLFEEMLWADAVRGGDSTGAFSVLGNTQVKVVKNKASPEFLIGTKAWDKFRSTAVSSGHILVGHNRKATQGEASRENAHPFAENNIVLVHNGTVFNHKDMKDVNVDSHAICHGISEKGYKETIENIEGSFALVWYDLDSKKLNFIRNDQRPLCFGENDDFVFFASEGYMLAWLLNRNNIKVEKLKMFEPMELVSIEFTPKFEVTKEKLIKKVKTYSNTGGWDSDQWEWVGGIRRRKQYSHHTHTPAARLPFTPSANGLKLQTFLNNYSVGDDIIFLPKSMKEDAQLTGRWKIEGSGYLPGKPMVNNVIWLTSPGVEWEDAVELSTEDKLIGKIRNICTVSDGSLVVWLGDAKTDTELNCWNGLDLPMFEWDYIANNFKCSKCESKLDPHKNMATSISIEMKQDGPVTVRCICHDCVAANKDKMPKEQQDALQQVSGLAL